MAQAISIAEFVTALAGDVLPSHQSQRFFVATSEGNIHAFTSHSSDQYEQALFAHIDDALFNGAAAYTAKDVQHVIAATMDGNIYHLTEGTPEPKLLMNFDGAMFSALSAYASPAGGVQYAVVATGEGLVYHLTIQDGEEVVQEQLGEFSSGVIGASGFVTPGDETQHIFVAASDGYIHHFTVRPGQAAEQQVMAFFEESFISLASYLTPDGLLNIIPTTRDGKLYHVTYDASKGQEVHVDIRDGIEFHDATKTPGVKVGILKRFYQVNESGMMFITGYATANDDTQHVLVASSDGAITHFSFQGTAYNDLKYSVVAQFQSMV